MSSTDLTELLRASRPVAPEALRQRVRAIAAPAPAAARRRLHLPALPPLRLAVPAAAAVAVAAAVLVAVVRPSHQGSQTVAAHGGQSTALSNTKPADRTRVERSAAAPKTFGATPSATGAAPGPAAGRAQDYEAQIALEVAGADALSSATKSAMTIARSLGGYVVSAQYAAGGTGRAALTLRVPTAHVQDAIAQLTSLGKITSQQVQITDVQDQLDGLDRAVAVLRTRIAHLTALLAGSGLTTERRAQLEAERAQLQERLRGDRQQRAATAREASLATIQLSLATRRHSAVVPAPSSRLRRSLDEAGRILAWEAGAALYGLVVVVPLALLAVLTRLAAGSRRRAVERGLLGRG